MAKSLEQQLQEARAAQAKLAEQLRKAKKAKRRDGSEWKPSFPGQHRGY